MTEKAKVTNRYRFNSGKAVFTFFANEEELLGVEVNHSDELDIEGPFLTKSNPKIEEAIKAIHAVMNGETDDINLEFKENSKEFNKKIKDALK